MLTVIATVILLAHTWPISFVASVAMATPVSDADLRELRAQFVVEAAAKDKDGGLGGCGAQMEVQAGILPPVEDEASECSRWSER